MMMVLMMKVMLKCDVGVVMIVMMSRNDVDHGNDE